MPANKWQSQKPSRGRGPPMPASFASGRQLPKTTARIATAKPRKANAPGGQRQAQNTNSTSIAATAHRSSAKSTSTVPAEVVKASRPSSDQPGPQSKGRASSPPGSSSTTPAATWKGQRPRKARPATKAEAPKPFRFLDLPPELRNIIYELVYPDPPSERVIELSALPHTHIEDALTLVSRQVRSESMGYYRPAVLDFWRHNDFSFDVQSPWPDQLLGEHYMCIASPKAQYFLSQMRSLVITNLSLGGEYRFRRIRENGEMRFRIAFASTRGNVLSVHVIDVDQLPTWLHVNYEMLRDRETAIRNARRLRAMRRASGTTPVRDARTWLWQLRGS